MYFLFLVILVIVFLSFLGYNKNSKTEVLFFICSILYNFRNDIIDKLESLGGREKGIRTPGGVTLNGFQDRRFRPLSHLPIK